MNICIIWTECNYAAIIMSLLFWFIFTWNKIFNFDIEIFSLIRHMKLVIIFACQVWADPVTMIYTVKNFTIVFKLITKLVFQIVHNILWPYYSNVSILLIGYYAWSHSSPKAAKYICLYVHTKSANTLNIYPSFCLWCT